MHEVVKGRMNKNEMLGYNTPQWMFYEYIGSRIQK